MGGNPRHRKQLYAVMRRRPIALEAVGRKSKFGEYHEWPISERRDRDRGSKRKVMRAPSLTSRKDVFVYRIGEVYFGLEICADIQLVKFWVKR